MINTWSILKKKMSRLSDLIGGKSSVPTPAPAPVLESPKKVELKKPEVKKVVEETKGVEETQNDEV